MTTAFGTGVTGSDGRLLDQIQLSGVSARGYHGVLPSERQTGQEFRADVVLYLDTRAAAAGDDLAQTVSYADVASDVHDILTGEPADLVETVAERIAAAVLARPQVEAVDVRVHKPHAPIPVPFADVEVAIRRDRTNVPVVAAPAALAGTQEASAPAGAVSGASGLHEAPAYDAPAYEDAPYEAPAFAASPQDAFAAAPLRDSWNDAAEHARGGSDATFAAEPEPQDFEHVVRPAADEPERLEQEPYRPEQAESTELRSEAFEQEPLVERFPAPAAPAEQFPVEEPEPAPVPELIAPQPLQVVPAAWEPQVDAPAQPEQPEQRPQEPAFQPDGPLFQAEQQLGSGPVFEPVQQYESLQGLDQRNGFDQQHEQQQYDQFAQQPEQSQPEQAQQFDQAQQYDQAQQFQQQPEPQQPAAQQNHYDQLFEQQYEQGEPDTTRVSAAVPDSAVGQPEQYASEQFQPEFQQAEQFQQPAQFEQPAQFQQPEQPEPFQPQQYQAEPRDRFDEIPAGQVDVVVAIGANLGDPQATMRSAVAELDRMPGLQITDVSPLARTAAVGGPEDQPDYLNAVLLARTTLSARGLLEVFQEVENVHGRTREERWGARTLDVDLITYGNLTDAAEDLEVPHPRAHERAFVLEPWSQIAPDAVLPGLGGGPVAQLAATAPDRAGIRWLALDWLTDPEPEQGGGNASNNAATADGGTNPGQDAPVTEMPPALPPSLPPSGRPPVSSGGPVVEVPGGGHAQGQHGGQADLEPQAQGAPQQEIYPGGGHPQAFPSGPVPGSGGSVPVPQQVVEAVPRGAAPVGMTGNGSVVPPPEEALVPAPPIAPRAVRDTARETPEHEPLSSSGQAKPVFAPVNPSRQTGSVFPPTNGAAPQEQAAPVFSPVGPPPNGAPDQGQNGHTNGQPNGQLNGHREAYDNDHTVIRVPGYATEQHQPQPQQPPADGPIDSVPSWVPVRDERGRDA